MILASSAIDLIGGIIWGPFMLTAFLAVGLMFTVRTGFFQFSKFRLWFSSTFLSLFLKSHTRKTSDENSISQFQALSASLAACGGTGNIVGVATAICAGGPGAVFWMWFSSLLGMMTCYAENVLGIKYRYKNEKREWIGGAMIYIEKGLGSKTPSIMFSLFCMIAAFGIGNMTQSNSIALALKSSFSLSPLFVGVVCALLVGLVIAGGIKRIAGVAEKIVPLVTVIYVFACIAVIAVNYSKIIPVIGIILKDAFNFKSAAGGAAGFGISKAMRYGISRGVFSNEAGLGSSAIIHCNSDVKEPVVQGMWGILEVFIDTIVMCTMTALAILTSGVWSPSGTLNGVALSTAAFETVFGRAGNLFISLSIVTLAFSTLIGWSYLGERGAKYVFGEGSARLYKAVFIIIIVIGSVTQLEYVWSISDIFNGMMAIPNLIAITLLSREVITETKTFLRKRE